MRKVSNIMKCSEQKQLQYLHCKFHVSEGMIVAARPKITPSYDCMLLLRFLVIGEHYIEIDLGKHIKVDFSNQCKLCEELEKFSVVKKFNLTLGIPSLLKTTFRVIRNMTRHQRLEN